MGCSVSWNPHLSVHNPSVGMGEEQEPQGAHSNIRAVFI